MAPNTSMGVGMVAAVFADAGAGAEPGPRLAAGVAAL